MNALGPSKLCRSIVMAKFRWKLVPASCRFGLMENLRAASPYRVGNLSWLAEPPEPSDHFAKSACSLYNNPKMRLFGVHGRVLIYGACRVFYGYGGHDTRGTSCLMPIAP